MFDGHVYKEIDAGHMYLLLTFLLLKYRSGKPPLPLYEYFLLVLKSRL